MLKEGERQRIRVPRVWGKGDVQDPFREQKPWFPFHKVVNAWTAGPALERPKMQTSNAPFLGHN